jgi:hypothetical protein
MQTVTGRMVTDRADRYAKQLFSHWSARGEVTEEDGVSVQRWPDGQVIVLRPVEGALVVEVSVPDGGDAQGFGDVVKRHLERFGQRDELEVVWDA